MSIRWRLTWIGGLVAASLFLLLPRDVVQRSYDPASGRMVETTTRNVPIRLGLDLRGGVHLALEVDESKGAVGDCADAISRAERVVRARLDEFGTSDRAVHTAGGCRLIVELPGMQDPARARDLVQRTAFLEFRLSDARGELRDALPAMDAALRQAGHTGAGLGTMLMPGQVPGEFLVAEQQVPEVDRLLAHPDAQRRMPRGVQAKWASRTVSIAAQQYRALYAVAERPIVTGDALRSAIAGIDPTTGVREVRFELSRNAAQQFGEATGRNIGNHLAILLDGRVEGQPPQIQSRITTSGRIELTGRSLQEANDLALTLRAGALPVPLKVVDQRTIGPSLGADAIRAGVLGSAIAVILVLAVMVAYYRLAGLLAVGGLLLYVLFTLAGLAAVGSALTLPGLAGFALSIGMALDANVLVFERMREELGAGRPLRAAVNDGFRHAMSAIVDSSVTTALTALILYRVGSGPVQGFAVTLLIGLVASMITAVFVTRTFFLLWLRRRRHAQPVAGLSPRIRGRAGYDFLALRRWALRGSLLFMIPALLVLAVTGTRYSVEFTGGTLTHVRTAERVEPGVLRTALANGGVASAGIQRFGSDHEYVIRSGAHGEQDAEPEAAVARVAGALDAGLSSDGWEMVRSEEISPRVGGELKQKAYVAVVLSFAATLVYLAFRFEWRFGLAAVLATAHDILATLAFMRYLDLEVSLVVVAAVLTVLGYSLNDTIVIFDRARENLSAGSRRNTNTAQLRAVLNTSITETLPRTLITGGTTLAAALVLAVLAGEVIRPFALVMGFGIVVGTFSSIFIAAPVLVWISEHGGRRKVPG